MDENKYKEDLKASGVQLDELDEKTEPEEPKEPKEPAETKAPVIDPEKKAEESKVETDEKKPTLTETKPEERKPRSIYQDLKDKKSEAKAEKERADKAEEKAAELQQQIDGFTAKAKDGDTPSDADEQELIQLAEESGANPELVKRILEVARKGVKTGDYDTLKKDIDEIKTNSQKVVEENNKILEQQHFDEEFSAVLPTIKEFFPNASEEEIKTIKKTLDTVSHEKDWADKDLDYIVFKMKDDLGALVTPKKRGMESHERKEIADNTYEFDPNPDFSKMTFAERDKWESDYRQAGKSDGLAQGRNGKKIIL